MLCLSYGAPLRQGVDLPSGDYSAEFKQRFADGYADGATITMLQHEFGLAKSTVKLWRERIDQGGVGAIDRPKKNNRYPQGFKLRVVEAYLRGEGDYKALALEHGVRNSAQIREWVKRYREGGEDALVVHPPGRRRKEPASGETLERRCARLEMEVGMSAPRAPEVHRDAALRLLLPRGEPSLGQAGDRAAGHSGDMREIPVQIRIPTRCRRVAQSGRHSHRRQDSAQGRARGGAAGRTRRRRRRRSCMGRFGESSPDLPARDFGAEGPMAKPAADVAEFKVGGAKPCLSPVVDPCNDEVVA